MPLSSYYPSLNDFDKAEELDFSSKKSHSQWNFQEWIDLV